MSVPADRKTVPQSGKVRLRSCTSASEDVDDTDLIDCMDSEAGVFKKPKQRKQSRRKKLKRRDDVQDEVRDAASQNAATCKASYNVDDLNGTKMPSDHADHAVRAIQLENAELRRKVQELRIQMNVVLSFLDIKNVTADAKNNHTDPTQSSCNENNTKSFSSMVKSTILKSNKSHSASFSSSTTR